jgi:apolipoprotein N-acyltransferase
MATRPAHNGGMSVWRALTRPARWAAIAAGALPVLAFPAPDLGFLAWGALVPGLLLMRAAPSWREAAVCGWWFGTGYMLATHYWLAPNIGPGLLLAALALGFLWIGVGVSTRALLGGRVSAGRALAALPVVPSYWLIIEWIRSWQALGGPWALLGASQWRYPPVLALAAVGGVWLITFAIVAANVGLVILAAARPLPLRLLGAAAAAVAVAAGPAAYALTPPVLPQRYFTVALVQPGLDRNPAVRAAASRRLSEGLAARRPDLIVWGESSIGFDLRRSPLVLHRIERLSAADRAEILVNQDSLVPGGKSKTALLVSPRGIRGSYVKSRLVPFGEYIPLRGELGWLTRISRAAPVNMIPGPGARVLTVTGPRLRPVRIGVLICFESAFPDMSRADARFGAQLLVYQTSDATFQQSWAPAQHASLGALRAAETGRPAVQAALTGDSVAFDARGRLLGSLTTSQRGVLLVRVGLPPASALTPFDRAGEVVPWLAIIIAIVAAAMAVLPSRRMDRPGEIPLGGNHRRFPSVFIMKRSPGEGPAPPAPHQGGDEASSRRAQRLPARLLPRQGRRR